MNPQEEIALAYSNVIGQGRIIENRILAHTAYAMGSNEPCNVLFTGEAGLGKTHLLRAEIKARTKACEIRFQRDAEVSYFKSPQEFRLVGDCFFDMVQGLHNGDGVVVDELHEVQLRPTVQIGKFLIALKQLMDNGQGQTRVARLDEENVVSRSAENIYFACGTNYPQTIKDPPSSPALVARLSSASTRRRSCLRSSF